MPLNRRDFLRMAGSGAGALALAAQAPAALAAEAPFAAPTAARPLRLCFNENALGMSEAAKKAAARAVYERASLYPFMRCEDLRKACAAYMKAKPETIVLTHGSAEAIRAAIESHIEGPTQLVTAELTYSDGEDCARRNGLKVVKVPMGKNWSMNIKGMKEAVAAFKGRSIVYFVNPNNPTGTICNSRELNDWIRSKPADTFFVVDEAYGEYVDDKKWVSAATLVQEGLDNLCVLKTFSKLFAMAGMRVGFSYSTKKTADTIRSQVAYDVMLSIPSVEAALAELADKDFIERSRAENKKAREITCGAFDELGIEYLPSQTNFVLMRLKGSLKDFAGRMKAEHILVGRPFPPADNWCRISFGTVADMQYFVKKLREFRAKGWV